MSQRQRILRAEQEVVYNVVMKKFIVFCLLVFSAVAVFFGCANGGVPFEPSVYRGNVLGYTRFRTDWIMFDGIQSAVRPIPPLTHISSHEDLVNYIAGYDDWAHFGHWGPYPHHPIRPQFFIHLEGYDEEFFQTRQLLIVRMVEGSGSIGHEIDGVSPLGNVYVNRLTLPPGYFGTADMAGWSIVVEISQDIAPEQFALVIGQRVS